MRSGLLRHVRPLVRDAALSILARIGVLAPDRRVRDSLTIVTFHRVLPEPKRRAYPHPGLAVTPDELAWIGAFLRAHFEVGPLTPLYERFRRGERSDKPLLALTFDDAPLDNFVFARPVLDDLEVRATFFVPVAHVESGAPLWHDRFGFALLRGLERPEVRRILASHGVSAPGAGGNLFETIAACTDAVKALSPEIRGTLIEQLEPDASIPPWAGMMTWDQLRSLAEDGHEIGSHSMSHPLLPQCSGATIVDEVVTSRRRLESSIGRPVRAFCYPNGDFDARSREAVAAAGYACAVVTKAGRNTTNADPFTLRRSDMHPAHVRDRRGALSTPRLAFRLSALSGSPS